MYISQNKKGTYPFLHCIYWSNNFPILLARQHWQSFPKRLIPIQYVVAVFLVEWVWQFQDLVVPIQMEMTMIMGLTMMIPRWKNDPEWWTCDVLERGWWIWRDWYKILAPRGRTTWAMSQWQETIYSWTASYLYYCCYQWWWQWWRCSCDNNYLLELEEMNAISQWRVAMHRRMLFDDVFELSKKTDADSWNPNAHKCGRVDNDLPASCLSVVHVDGNMIFSPRIWANRLSI